jgi:hypothetical protein
MASQSFTLAANAWTDLGAAPQSVQVINGGSVHITVQSSAPAAGAAYHVISNEVGRTDNVTVTYTGNVYARAGSPSGAVVTASN